VLSTGPTDGLSSWWPRNWSPPTAYNDNNKNKALYKYCIDDDGGDGDYLDLKNRLQTVTS